MRLIFLGAPGAGKGTQAELMHQRLKVTHLASGDLLRQAASRKEPIGQEIARKMQEGVLVPDSLVTGLMLQHVDAQGTEGPFVLDGFPRTVEQARALDETLEKRKAAAIDLVVDFEISQEAVQERLSGRRVCSRCGANYHVDRLPPKRKGLCDQCGGPLMIRRDDEPETIRRRLEVYETQTRPLLDYYRRQEKLRPLSGELSVEKQYEALLQLLQKEDLVRAS